MVEGNLVGARYRYDMRDIFVIFWKFGLERGERKIEIAGISSKVFIRREGVL